MTAEANKMLQSVGGALHSEWDRVEGLLLQPPQSDAKRLRAISSLVAGGSVDDLAALGGGAPAPARHAGGAPLPPPPQLQPPAAADAAAAAAAAPPSVPLAPGRSLKSLPIKEQVWILMDNPSSSRAAQLIATVVMATIILSCVAMVVQTLPEYIQSRSPAWSALEYFCISVFSLELGLRLWSCPSKLHFLRQPLNLVDMLAVTPVFLELALASTSTSTSGSAIIRVIRLLRIFRVFKITRYLPWVRVFTSALWTSTQPLLMLLLLVLIAVVLFSSAIYYAERGEWDEVGGRWMSVDITGRPVVSLYQSVPHSFWWCIVTMTTVGYGDMTPVTSTGRFIAALASMSGILVLAIPVSIISTNFNVEFGKLMRQKEQVKARMALLSKHFREDKTGLEAVLDEVEDLVTRNTQELQGELSALFESARLELTEELQEILRMAYERRRQLHLAALSAGQVQAGSSGRAAAQAGAGGGGAEAGGAGEGDAYAARGAVAGEGQGGRLE